MTTYSGFVRVEDIHHRIHLGRYTESDTLCRYGRRHITEEILGWWGPLEGVDMSAFDREYCPDCFEVLRVK